MNRRLRLTTPLQVLLAGATGLLLGNLLASPKEAPTGEPWVICKQVADLVGTGFLAWCRALAWPLIASSVVLGAVGLEPMRGLGKITGKTFAWLALNSVLAVLIGAATPFLFYPREPVGKDVRPDLAAFSAHGAIPVSADLLSTAAGGPFVFVLLWLAFAYYRNQIGERRGQMFVRLCQGLEEMLKPLLVVTNRLLPWGAFALLLAAGLQSGPEAFWKKDPLLPYALKSLLLAWAIFGLVVLPGVLWACSRINPWRLWAAMSSAALLALAGGSLEAALPLTMHALRDRLHLSNRVAGPVLSLAATFQRDGMALGCTVMLFCHWRTSGASHDGLFYLGALASCWLVAFGAGSLLGSGVGLAGLVIGWLEVGGERVLLFWGLARLVIMGGAALSVFSHSCIAVLIARGEGEFWVPGPPPDPDELQGLKNDLASVDN